MALENLSPVVREERLLAGENLKPVTRLEYFLKQAGSGGGSGGGGTAFVVHMVTGIGVETHLDRSYNEIVAAITNGQAIQVIRSGQSEGYPYNLFLLMVRVGQDGAQSFSADIFDFAASEMLTFRSESADGQLEEEPQP